MASCCRCSKCDGRGGSTLFQKKEMRIKIKIISIKATIHTDSKSVEGKEIFKNDIVCHIGTTDEICAILLGYLIGTLFLHYLCARICRENMPLTRRKSVAADDKRRIFLSSARIILIKLIFRRKVWQ